MEDYGPVSNLWEGGYNGEKYSQELKHRLKGGLRDNWHKRLLENVLEYDCMRRIEMPILDEKDMESKNKKDCWYKKYNSIVNLRQEYLKRRPLSIVVLANGMWRAIIKNEQTMTAIIVEEYHSQINGMNYWYINAPEDPVIDNALREDDMKRQQQSTLL